MKSPVMLLVQLGIADFLAGLSRRQHLALKADFHKPKTLELQQKEIKMATPCEEMRMMKMYTTV